ASSRAIPIPIPPPPMTAFTITGNPTSLTASRASSAAESGPAPGSTGNPLFSNAVRHATLSPASSSTWGGGPTQATPASITASNKVREGYRVGSGRGGVARSGQLGGEPPDGLTRVAPVPAQRPGVRKLALPSPPGHGLRGDVKDLGDFRRGQIGVQLLLRQGL